MLKFQRNYIMKKTILHVISSLKIGGAEMLLPQLIADLGSQEWEHEVLYFHDGPVLKLLKEKNIKTTQINGLVCLYDPVFVYRLYKYLKNNRLDIIHSALWAANFFCRIIAWLLKIPHVAVLHLEIEHEGAVRNILDCYTYSFTQKVVTVSPNVTKSLVRQQWIPAQKIIEIQNGIHAEHVQEMVKKCAVTRKELGIPEDSFVIGSVGRLIARKNFDVLIKSVAQLVEKNVPIRLVIVGSGAEEDNLRKLISFLGCADKIMLITGKQAYGYYCLFDCFALVSQAEGLSIALLEAMVCALPVIITESAQEHALIINKKNGVVIKPNAVQDLKEALQFLLHSKALAGELGCSGKETVLKHASSFAMAFRYQQLFESLIRTSSLKSSRE